MKSLSEKVRLYLGKEYFKINLLEKKIQWIVTNIVEKFVRPSPCAAAAAAPSVV